MSAIIASGGNPLDFLTSFNVEWQMLVSQALSFAIVASALYFFVFKPVMAASNERKAKIEQGLKDAETAKEKLASAESEAAAKTADASREASKILKDARDDAKAAVEKSAADASAKAAEIRARNDEQLARDKTRMLDELKGELSTLVARAAEKVVADVLTDEQRGKLSELASKELEK